MIDVKGTRTSQVAPDATDPLGVRKPADAGNGAISGMIAGIIGIAVYLRSFLWFEPQTAHAAAPPAPDRAGPDGDTAAPARVPREGRFAEAAKGPDHGSGTRSETEDPTVSFTLPLVFGPFEVGVFAAAPSAMPAGSLDIAAANSPLPPFDIAVGQTGPDPTAGPATVPQPDPAQFVQELQLSEHEADPDLPGTTTSPRNRAPRNSGPVYLGDVGSAATLAIALSHLLVNSSDPDGDPLSVTMGPSSLGSVEPHGGNWRFVADSEHLGEVRISYEISDGTVSVTQTAVLNVVENRFDGTEGADLMLGTEGRDRILAMAGDDNIAGFAGRDIVHGGAGDDNIAGGSGHDTLFGEDGNDIISGGSGDDRIWGGAGEDRLYGEDGNDEVHGDAGNDLVDGGDGHDTLTGGDGDDLLLAGAGDDLAAGGEGADLLQGEDGADVLFGDAGEDQLFGGAGEDLLFGGLGADLLDGGTANDILTGDDGDDTLLGNDGDDVALAGDGDDSVHGGAGNDHLSGDSGNDTLAGGMGADTVLGGQGEDTIMLDADSVADLLVGGDGSDVLVVATDAQGVQFDLIAGSVESEATGTDLFLDIEAFVGSAGDDTFCAAEGEATFTGNGGADLYQFIQGDVIESAASAYRITDFDSDDRVTFNNLSSGVVVRRVQRELESQIEDFFEDFADRFDADEPRLRYFHEWTDEYHRTVVEVDFDRDDTADLIMVLDGDHVLDISPASTGQGV